MQANSSEIITPAQAKNSLADRVRWVLRHFGLEQAQLAELMGVKLDRVKSLVLGRAKNLRVEELARLVDGLRLRQAWLVHGELPELEPDVAEPVPSAPPAGHVRGAEVDAAVLAREMAARPYRRPDMTDERLLQEVVSATAAELDARGIQLAAEQRLRLYWGVFELSVERRQVNGAAIKAMVALIQPPGRPG